MSEVTFFNWLVAGMLISAMAVFIALFFIAAPYGRHSRTGWGPTISDKLGWIVMESSAPVMFFACYLTGHHNTGLVAFAFLAMWELHYIQRAFIFPFTLRNVSGRMALVVIFLGFIFNMANAYINGRFVFDLSGGYPANWLLGPRFILGATFFISGYIINRHSDWTLRNLRRPGESGYKIPQGGLYRWISCPNYFGEILIWAGWAMATWSLPGLAFAIWTAANLIPRARSHQRWYQQNFPDYPENRKTLIPLLW
jgi:steroid 5-alpha-reductase/3-oxo-5-alpha-steroid 4-dehydrogenase 1